MTALPDAQESLSVAHTLTDDGLVRARLDDVLDSHRELQEEILALKRRIATLHERVAEAETWRREAEQVRYLKARLAELSARPEVAQEPMTDEAAEEEEADGVGIEGEEVAQLREELTSLRVEQETLSARLAEVERERDAALDQARRRESEIDSWVAEADALSGQLEQERRRAEEAEELAEWSMSEAELAKQQRQQVQLELMQVQQSLEQTREELNEERRLRLLLETQLAERQSAWSTPSQTEEMLRLLREIVRAERHTEIPWSQLMDTVCQLRRDVDAIRYGQERLESLVAERVSVLPATESILDPAESSAYVPTHDSDRVESSTEVAEEMAVHGADDTASDETRGIEEDWPHRFDRIERAWLAGLRVGDEHEATHFRSIVRRVRQAGLRIPDEAALLAALDTVRNRFGDDFEYCLLDAALGRLHRPALDPTLLVVQMRNLKRGPGRHWR